MKKILIIFSVLFVFNITNVTAKTDWTTGVLTCNYKKNNDSISITYYNVGAALGDADVYYSVSKTLDNKTYCYTNSFVSKCGIETEPWIILGIYNYDSSFFLGEQRFYGIKSRLTRTGYNEEANFNEDELCSVAVMITDADNDTMDDIILCETNEERAKCDYENDNLFTLNGKTLGKTSYAGSTEIDYTDSYNENKKEQEEYCKENYIQTNGNQDCETAKNDLNTTIEEAEKSGTTQAELDKGYLKNPETNSNWDGEENDCSSYLGYSEYNPNQDSMHQDPAYYLQFSFNLMKYIAIVLLFVLTIIEFAKAIVSSNQDAIKKAMKTSIKRLIICIIIFFLPVLIEFLFKIFGIYSNCNIK